MNEMDDFQTSEQEASRGRALIFEIVNCAKSGRPYKKKIVELWDIAERNDEVWALCEHLVLSLAKRNGNLK